jgi:Flp pilus assembly protein CpaB
VAIAENNSPAGLIAPGDFVDVIVAGDLKGIVPASGVAVKGDAGSDFKAVVTLLQNVQVLAVQDSRIEDGVPYDTSVRGEPPDLKSINHVTLGLTPEQSQLLWLAVQNGKVTLALRAFGDAAVAPLPPIAEPITIK